MVQCVIVAVKNIGNILLVTVLLLFMFAVIGVQLFKGRFWMCSDRGMQTEDDCHGEYLVPKDGSESLFTVHKRVWAKNEFNFEKNSKTPHSGLL